MMTAGHKLTIFFVLTIVLQVKTEYAKDEKRKPDFKPFNSIQSKSEKVENPIVQPEPPSTKKEPPIFIPRQITTTTEYNFIECNPHGHIFKFSNVGLQKIGQDFIKSHDIIKLSLDNNNISEISPFAFRNTQNLKYLDLTGNNIPKAKLLMMNGNVKLEELIINNNRDFRTSTQNIMNDYEVFPNLKYLHLSNSQLNNFLVPYFTATPKLTHLYINNNSIDSSEIVFDNIPTTLTHLHLNKNFITGIQQGKLRHLQELIMNENNITKLCYENCEDESIYLKNAELLTILSLSNNQISEISENAFHDTHYLLELDLSNNKITNIHQGTFNTTRRIQKLSLANNKLSAIPNICSIYNLKILDLSGNHIGAISSNAFCLYQMNLQELYLSNNIITTVENEAFFGLHNLQYLDLSGNRLRQLPTYWLHPLSGSIQDLHLERNSFTDLDSVSLINIKTMKNVYLDENPMPTLSAGSFHLLSKHLKVHLRNVFVENKCAECSCDNDEDNDENSNNANNSYDYNDQ
ncbi:hypothetical protein PUN28_003914 [Cardiocondyla obscurior]|uniref:Leucine-rich repeat protein n=1 Tax=Cardiocondyla obscurior TaxID=286306 RepID=A0AAW2GPD7_9HYME